MKLSVTQGTQIRRMCRRWLMLPMLLLFVCQDVTAQVVAASSNRESDTSTFSPSLYLKTNAVGWGMLISNIAVETDIDDQWSVNFPIYFSAMNYFTSTVKFRTFALQPEIRHWFSDNLDGWFAGAHLGLAWFNYAKGGDWCYQDHNRHTPLLGGGISAGYRKPISQDKRWWFEFSLGTGVYRLHYDKFQNEHNGQRVDTRKRTFFGIDNVAVSFAYRFDMRKKGGKQ